MAATTATTATPSIQPSVPSADRIPTAVPILSGDWIWGPAAAIPVQHPTSPPITQSIPTAAAATTTHRIQWIHGQRIPTAAATTIRRSPPQPSSPVPLSITRTPISAHGSSRVRRTRALTSSSYGMGWTRPTRRSAHRVHRPKDGDALLDVHAYKHVRSLSRRCTSTQPERSQPPTEHPAA